MQQDVVSGQNIAQSASRVRNVSLQNTNSAFEFGEPPAVATHRGDFDAVLQQGVEHRASDKAAAPGHGNGQPLGDLTHSSPNLEIRHKGHQASAPVTHISQLVIQFLLQVPGEDDDKIRPVID